MGFLYKGRKGLSILSYTALKMDSDFDFLEIYDDTLSKEECNHLITQFDGVDPGRKVYGAHGGAEGGKKATTLFCDLRENVFDDFNKTVVSSLAMGLPKYKERYSFLDEQLAWDISRYYNVQKYTEGQGYYALHCEHFGGAPFRMLVWMIYLNDAECGTEFPYQNKTVDAKAGRLVIWPAAWSHPHKGVTPNKGLKYIATGWYSYSVPKYLYVK